MTLPNDAAKDYLARFNTALTAAVAKDSSDAAASKPPSVRLVYPILSHRTSSRRSPISSRPLIIPDALND
jgi:hypothetical protein